MKYIYSFVLICATTFAFSQQGTISGTILQADSTAAVSGATLFLDKTTHYVISKSNGSFIMTNLPEGEYYFVATYPGYKKYRTAVTVKDGENLELSIILSENVMDLPEMVIKHTTMTGGDEGMKEMPGSAYYLSPKELQKFGHTDLNRALRNVPGVNIQEEDGFGLRSNIGLRGSGVERSSKITLMEDGILVAPAPYAAPAAYYTPTFGRMQAVEIMKGSSQIKYGPYTTGGAINFISRQIPSDFSGTVNALGGSFGGRNVSAFVGNSHKNVGYSIESFHYGSKGFKELDGGGNTGFHKTDYIAKVRVNTNPNAKIYQSLSVKLGQAEELSHETYLGLTRDDFNENPYRRYAASQVDRMETFHTQVSATHIAKLTKFLSITSTVYRNEFKRNWYKLDAVTDSLGNKVSISNLLDNPADHNDAYNVLTGETGATNTLYVKGNNRTHYAQGVQSTVGIDFKTGEIQHDIDLGIRYHQDQMDRFQYQDEYQMVDGRMLMTEAGAAGRESNRLTNAYAFASHIQYNLKYKKFSFTPGLRHEYITLKESDFGKNDPDRTGANVKMSENVISEFIPGVALDYAVTKKINAFAGVHKGFSPPGANPNTRPESSINYEVGAKYSTHGISGQLVGFYNDYSNLLGSDLAAAGGFGTGDLFNGGAVETFGVEFLVSYDVLRKSKSKFNFPVTIGYTFTEATFKSSFNSSFEDWGQVNAGDKLPYLSNNQLSLNASLEHAKFSVNISGKYNSEMRTTAGQGTPVDEELIPAYFVLDVSASYNIIRQVSLFVSGNNLTNATYLVATRPAGLRPGMPLSFQLGLRCNF